MMLLIMDNKSWLVEVEAAARIGAGAIVAPDLIVGHTVWMSVARK
jgi:hypothetical protein